MSTEHGAGRVLDQGGPLEGVRVLDLAIILAGPTCGRTLAELGADVVKVDDPLRDQPARDQIIEIDRGKRSVFLDARTPQGREALWKLVDTADVIVENYRAGKLDALGFGYADVAKRRPGIVYCSLNAFGFGGRWSDRPGWEQNAQAMTGMQVRRGGRDAAPRTLTYAFADYGGGITGAFAVMLGLLERARTGRGQHVRTSLAAASSLLQSRYLLDFARYRHADIEGVEAKGESALIRLYRASDDWFFLHATRAQLAAVPALRAALAHEDDAPLAAALAHAFAREPRAAWLRVLRDAGAGAAERLRLADIEADPFAERAGLIARIDDPALGAVQLVGPGTVTMSRSSRRLGRLIERLGGDWDDVMGELGYSAAERERLRPLIGTSTRPASIA